MKSVECKPHQMVETTPMMKEGPRYPYGLELSLNEETLKAIDMKELPDTGTEVTITAKAFVSSRSESKNLYGEHRSLGLQITAMEVKNKKEDK